MRKLYYAVVVSMLSLSFSSAFAMNSKSSALLGEKSVMDCCPYGNNCGGKQNCPGTGFNKNASSGDRSNASSNAKAKAKTSRATGE